MQRDAAQFGSGPGSRDIEIVLRFSGLEFSDSNIVIMMIIIPGIDRKKVYCVSHCNRIEPDLVGPLR